MKKLSISIILLLLGGLIISACASGPAAREQKDYLNSVKITFLSWISGSTKISYERALPRFRQSSEICASVIGAGYDKYHNDPMGFTVRYGHKFFFRKNDISLKGLYFRPEAVYSYYHYNCTDGQRKLADMGALLGTIGYQYVYKRFLADFWVGTGYSFGHSSETMYHHGFELWHWFNKRNENMAMSFSIRLGICF